MNIPADPSINYIAYTLFLLGLFLFISGINIIKIEKITILQGYKTWIVGLLLMGLSVFLAMPEIITAIEDKHLDRKNHDSINTTGIEKNNKQVNTLHSSDYPCSKLLDDNKEVRDSAFSDWMPISEYQKKLDKSLRNGKYPIYVESSDDGKRRWIRVKKKDGVGISVTTGRTLKDFKEQDKVRKARGRTLITVHCLEIDGTIFYSGVWVENEHFKNEVRQLKRYRIDELEW